MDRIEPRIHDEIKDYKEKFYNFTLRQWLFGILLIITMFAGRVGPITLALALAMKHKKKSIQYPEGKITIG